MRSGASREKRKAVGKQPPRRPAAEKRPGPLKGQSPAKMSAGVGKALREGRERVGLSVRELARRIHVSASLISLIERDRAMPSVSTLFAIANELGLVLDDLFKSSERSVPAARPEIAPVVGTGRGPVQRSSGRNVIRLHTGVRWERLTPTPDDEIEFLYVVYDVGGASCEDGTLFRHGGKEYGYVISGRLGIQIGFEKYEIGPGDSISFDAQVPHRLWAMGREPAVAIFAILRRHNDSRRNASPAAGA
ncbi:MAG: cupin domain-containing protein [Bradyrhizobiaceae bacterium]|nr:cupin domain-containing protein [Bradyrhizobiaceae bacterium]